MNLTQYFENDFKYEVSYFYITEINKLWLCDSFISNTDMYEEGQLRTSLRK